jgi:hypothetical protein
VPEQRAVLGLKPRPWVLAAQDCQLVAQDQDLNLLASADRQQSTINSRTRRSAR